MGAAVEGSFFNTDGFPIVAERERGPIDNNANVNYRNISAKLDYTPDATASTRSSGPAYFTEDRINGKVGEVNDTRWTTVNGGVRVRLPDESDLQARVFVDVERSHFNFLAVTNAATTRNIVRLATDQHVPTNGVGGTVQWSKAVGALESLQRRRRLAMGRRRQPGRRVRARGPHGHRRGDAGRRRCRCSACPEARSRSWAAFVQDIFTPVPKLVVTLSARVDRWRNYDGHNLETTVATGLPTVNNRPSIPERSDTVVSPRVAALYHLSDRVSVWGAANSGFRAPTLTELYRQFSVGAVTTRPNDQLGPERLVGGEAGVNVAPARNVTARVTWFDNRISNPVSNVTLNATTAQKQNLGATRIWGIQTRRGIPPRVVLETVGRLSLQSGQGHRWRRRERGARGQVPAAGAEAPGIAAGGVRESRSI